MDYSCSLAWRNKTQNSQKVLTVTATFFEEGSAVGMIGAPNLRPFPPNSTNSSRGFQCLPEGERQAAIMLSLGLMGVVANSILMSLILINKHMRRWSQGLLFHQGAVDCGRAAILLPLGLSILRCEPIRRCSLVETAFLLLVTVSTINILTTVLNDSPVFPDDDGDEDLMSGPLLMDSPQCVFFGTFMIWFASITINLGPTFLSGGLAARSEMVRNVPSCPLVHGPFRHYILNALWITINVICILLTLFHLHKLHRDLTKANTEAVKVAGLVTTLVNVTGSGVPNRSPVVTNSVPVGLNIEQRNGKPNGIRSALEEHRRMRNYLLRMEQEGIQKVKMFLIITAAYIIFWGPLFFITLVRPPLISTSTGYEITLHIAYLHAFVNPTLFIFLHRGLRNAAFRFCCGLLYDLFRNRNTVRDNAIPHPCEDADFVVEVPQVNLLVPPPPPAHHPPPVASQLNASPYHPRAQDFEILPNYEGDESWEETERRSITIHYHPHRCHQETISPNRSSFRGTPPIPVEIQGSEFSSGSESPQRRC